MPKHLDICISIVIMYVFELPLDSIWSIDSNKKELTSYGIFFLGGLLFFLWEEIQNLLNFLLFLLPIFVSKEIFQFSSIFR